MLQMPAGGLIERREVNRKTQEGLYLFRVPKDGMTGIYRVEIDDGASDSAFGYSQWEIERGPQKVMARLPKEGGIYTTGSHSFGWRYYFHVPEGTKEFSAKLTITVRGAYGGRVFDPAGNVRREAWWTGWEQTQNQRRITISDEKGLPPGIWSIGCKFYRGARLELEGIPPYVASRPDAAFEAR